MADKDGMVALDQPNFYNSQQSWFMKQHLEFKGKKLRVIIKRNAYEGQSSAIIQMLDPASGVWNTLASIPHSQMKANGSYVLKALSHSQSQSFIQDGRELVRQAKFLL